MNRKMHDRAFAGKWGRLGASEETVGAPARAKKPSDANK
jgi:hypothetical protein